MQTIQINDVKKKLRFDHTTVFASDRVKRENLLVSASAPGMLLVNESTPGIFLVNVSVPGIFLVKVSAPGIFLAKSVCLVEKKPN